MNASSKKQLKLDTFHKLFMELLNDLSIIKPNDTTLLWVKTAISLLDIETLVIQFMEYVSPYSKKILNRDETFFIDELHMEVEKESFAGKEISKVRAIWLEPSTTDDTKSCIWNYFILLLKLGNSILE